MGRQQGILFPPRAPLKRFEALTLAAWLAVLAETDEREGDDTDRDFASILEAVRNS